MKSDSETIEIEIEIGRRKSGRPKGSAPTKVAPAVPRVTRLMALALKFQEMVGRGEIRDYAEIARLGYITRARATQIMNLLHLAPDIQEHLLFLDGGPASSKLAEHELRAIATAVEWKEQRKLWKRLAGAGRALRGDPPCTLFARGA